MTFNIHMCCGIAVGGGKPLVQFAALIAIATRHNFAFIDATNFMDFYGQSWLVFMNSFLLIGLIIF